MAGETGGGEDDESQPDDGEADQFGELEGFMKNVNTQKELESGGEILQETESGKGDFTGSLSEEKQGSGSDCAGSKEQNISS